MAASDQTYRSQRKLDLVFGISALLMLIAVVLMFAQDYFQPWKTEQRTFRDVDEGITLQALLGEAGPALNKWQEVEGDAYLAREVYRVVKDKDPQKEAQVAFEKADNKRAGIKAIYDSKVSLLNIAKDNRDRAALGSDKSEAAHYDSEVKSLDAEVGKLKSQLDQAERDVDDKDQQLKGKKEDMKVPVKVSVTVTVGDEKKKKEFDDEISLNQAKKSLDDAEGELKKQTGKLDTLAKAVAKKKWGWGDFIRRLPLLDGFASPLKVNQITLEGYPIDYSFKRVTRYDRCTTCHLGIDQEKFDVAALRSLGEKQTKDAKSRTTGLLADLRKHYETRADHGETLGFDWKDLPKDMVHIVLTEGRVRQFAAHPRLDVFLDAKSPHPVEKFGCTSCHAGQGSSTTFNNASHVPNDAVEKKRWTNEHDWEMTHAGDWEYPMLAHRFVESSCLKCHRQVTDTISNGSREEAPKLLKGYNLIKEFGCYGCHEIAGFKQGQEIGPDLRLELSPPIESLPPGEREKLLADKTNPPGNLRKVGPSLYRLSEKTHPDWVMHWIRDPRGFRPDTKMPHFYGLSNNDKSVLPDEQKAFPDLEIQGIAQYLMEESKQYLSNKDGDYHDIYHRLYADRLKELEAKKNLTEKEKLELEDVKERLDPAKQKEKSPALQLWESPHRVIEQIIDGTGNVVSNDDIPQPSKSKDDLGEGGRLFRERGCLACHSHDATANKETDSKGQVRPVVGEANFGPNLSRIKAKLRGDGDDVEKRRWLIQWILNPNVHNPRTRMPITHLTPQQAARVADWLLSRDADGLEDWAKDFTKDVKTSELADLVRVYLAKAPDMTRAGVEDALKVKKDEGIAGFTEEQASKLKWSADERRLKANAAGTVDKSDMLWYVGRKAISRYGCYACHDIPGFETSKPVGTPLNDWGKKDPERLAFEDIVAYVKEHHKGSVVSRLRDEDGTVAAEPGDNPLYEQFYMDALEHHQRDGFLQQKLYEPRSFDNNRTLPWDDRLRMPQFQFARTAAKHKSEDPVSAQVQEAESREAVMTFILGLVAEPVPNAYTPHPDADRQAEIKGRQVLDKFNCAGCHMIRAGVYDFKVDDDFRKSFKEMFDNRAKSEIDKGYPEFFKDHNAWVGQAQARSDRVRIYGVEFVREEGLAKFRPTQAVRYEDKENGVLNIPAGVPLDLPAGAVIQRSTSTGLSDPTPYGGDFGELLMGKFNYQTIKRQDAPEPYMDMLRNVGDDVKRSLLPPPLHREGEKVQPTWLQRFLRDPKPIRPPERMLLRMPKFNMSDEEIDAVVRYFVAVDRLENPGASTTNAWLPPEQLSADYWQKRNVEYVKRLGKKVDDRQKGDELQGALKSYIELRFLPEIPQQLEEKKAQVQLQEQAVKDAKGSAKDDAEKKLKALRDEQKALEDRVKELTQDPEKAREKETKDALPKYTEEWKKNEEYATDAYHLLVARSAKAVCMQCHNVAEHVGSERQGPTLFFRKDQVLFEQATQGTEREAYIASERLRPEWMKRWIAQPARLHGFSTPMLQLFEKQPTRIQSEHFEGEQADRIKALRDVLMNTAPVADLPGNRFYRPKIEE